MDNEKVYPSKGSLDRVFYYDIILIHPVGGTAIRLVGYSYPLL